MHLHVLAFWALRLESKYTSLVLLPSIEEDHKGYPCTGQICLLFKLFQPQFLVDLARILGNCVFHGDPCGSCRTYGCVRVELWQNRFFVADFMPGPPDSSADLCTRCFLLFLWGARKILLENPRKIPKNLYNKNPRRISAEGPGQVVTRK